MKTLQEMLDEVEDLPETMSQRGLRVSSTTRNAGLEKKAEKALRLRSQRADKTFNERLLTSLRAKCATDEFRENNRKGQLKAWTEEKREQQRTHQREVQNRPDVKAKVSRTVKAAMTNPEVRRKVSEGTRKAMQNPETRKAISEKAKRKVTCPHCGKVGGISIMKRWHFENCKAKK